MTHTETTETIFFIQTELTPSEAAHAEEVSREDFVAQAQEYPDAQIDADMIGENLLGIYLIMEPDYG